MIRQNGLKGDSGSESNSSPGGSGGEEAKGAADGNEVQETLADLMQVSICAGLYSMVGYRGASCTHHPHWW